jgi:hypothetical protein
LRKLGLVMLNKYSYLSLIFTGFSKKNKPLELKCFYRTNWVGWPFMRDSWYQSYSFLRLMSCHLSDKLLYWFSCWGIRGTFWSMSLSYVSLFSRLYDTAIRLGKLQQQCKVAVEPEEYAQENLKFGLVEVVYEWAKVPVLFDIYLLFFTLKGQKSVRNGKKF